ncbi:MAG: alpha-amylase family glycosyl hydrolase [Melioribacteraceae bacterium]|nr:alpha-amylase family glycosyl hydrolase [Melioribacteraceae bacterium]
MNYKFFVAILLFVFLIPFIATYSQKPKSQYPHVEWSKNLSVYEINVRQHTSEGTFNSFLPHLNRLKEMNIGILWFMPIHPIGEKNRKGTLGSYYSIKNYKEVNPEFGSIDDFKKVVKEAHKNGMYVIIDWVANHTSWDNIWTKTNPEFYKKDKKGNFISPYDWTDVIALDYKNKNLWRAMLDAMLFWIEECDIDGFRCDVAAMVPLDFWKWAIPILNQKKKIFMLAEAHEPELHQVFDMTYNWQLKDLFVATYKKEKTAKDFYEFIKREKKEYPKDAYRMNFTSNHDENSWHGTDKERFGKAHEMFAVISSLIPGMPLVYSGQEACLDKRLKFFEKDPIEWKDCEMKKIYSTLFKLKKDNQALWNGNFGGKFYPLSVKDKNVFAFVRQKDQNQVVALFNISDNESKIEIKSKRLNGNYNELFSNKKISIDEELVVDLKSWGYKVFYR